MPTEYRCPYVVGEDVDWTRIEGVSLVDTTTGGKPRLSTEVKVSWTERHLLVRFECEDDYIVSPYTERDAPLYREDVVELFIDETGAGRTYLEFEISPYNVVFDAKIRKEPGAKPDVDSRWNAEGLITEVDDRAEGLLRYLVSIPFCVFTRPPQAGEAWRANFYRIDREPNGIRHYWAWSPTGLADFHRPETFGILYFEAGSDVRRSEEAGQS